MIRDRTHTLAATMAQPAGETPALDMLGLDIPAQLRDNYAQALQTVRSALIFNEPHPRPPERTQRTRGATAAASGCSSWMKDSRLNKIEHDPFAHFEKAKALAHPHARERAGRELPPDIVFAIDFALGKGAGKLAGFRQHQRTVWVRARKLVQSLNDWIRSHARRPSHVAAVTQGTNFAVLCLISDAVGCDAALAKDFLYGFQMMGHVADSGVHRPVTRMPAAQLCAQEEELRRTAWSSLCSLEKSVNDSGPGTPVETRAELTQRTNEQVALGRITGPFTREGLWRHLYGTPALKRAADGTILSPVCCRRFAVQQEGKVRPCEDWKASGQNAATSLAETVAPISFEEPALVAEAIFQRATARSGSCPQLHIAVDDVAAGYNNLPTDQEYVMCAWDDEANAARFYASRVMMFGSTASVNHFCRLPALVERLCTRLFATLARAYCDDWIITDFVSAGDSAQQALAAVHADIGIPLAACGHASCDQCKTCPCLPAPEVLPKCKRKRPSQVQELLGVVCDVSEAHLGRVYYSPKASRCAKVLRELRAAQHSGLLRPKQAERLCGKLQFICHSSIFGGIGRAQTWPLFRRAHMQPLDGQEGTSEAWTPAMSASLRFLELILEPSRLPRRAVYFQDTPPVILYSDAEGDGFYIGLVAFDPLQPDRVYSASGACPPWIMAHARRLCPDVANDEDGMINVVEMVGALGLLTTFPDLVRGRRCFMYQDNSTAFHCAITGRCKDAAVRDVGAHFHLAAAALGVGLWVDWVSTDAQLADPPSRIQEWRANGGSGHKHEATFASIVTHQRPLVLPVEDAWHDNVKFFDNMRCCV